MPLDLTFLLIGGNEIIIEVDETKMGKQKYNRNHQVEGVWIIVEIEISVKKVFRCSL